MFPATRRDWLNKRGLANILIYAAIISVCILVFELYQFLQEKKLISAADETFTFLVTSRASNETITVEPTKLGLFLNYKNTYTCPYYLDRADLIAPEINRLAQQLRAFGSHIIFQTESEAPTPTNSNVEVKEFPLKLDKTSPLFKDKCLYGPYDEEPSPLDGKIHHDILYSTTTDYFVAQISKVVDVAIDLKLSHVIVGGMKCNLWLPPLFSQLKSYGIQPIYIYDLSDVAYHRETQINKIDTHTKALEHFRKYLLKNDFQIVNHFTFIDRPFPTKPLGRNIKFNGNSKAYYHEDYFYPEEI